MSRAYRVKPPCCGRLRPLQGPFQYDLGLIRPTHSLTTSSTSPWAFRLGTANRHFVTAKPVTRASELWLTRMPAIPSVVVNLPGPVTSPFVPFHTAVPLTMHSSASPRTFQPTSWTTSASGDAAFFTASFGAG